MFIKFLQYVKCKGRNESAVAKKKLVRLIGEILIVSFHTFVFSDMKQLRWEMDRDRWVRGVDARTKVRAKKLQKGPKAKGFRGRGRGKKR